MTWAMVMSRNSFPGIVNQVSNEIGSIHMLGAKQGRYTTLLLPD